MLAVVLYFELIDPLSVHRSAGDRRVALLSIVGITTVAYLFLAFGLRRLCRGVQSWQDRLHAGASASDVPVEVRRRVLTFIPRLTVLTAAGWLLAILIELGTAPFEAGGLPRGFERALGFAGAGAVVSTAIIYFAGDLAWRPTVRTFFPHGRLTPTSAPRRVMLVRLLVAFLLTGVWLPALLVVASQSHRAGLIGPPHTVEYLLLGTCALVSVTLAVLVTRGITDPVNVLQAAMARVQRNDLDAEVSVGTNDEIGYLGERFNQMTAGLREREHIRRMFGQYVTNQVAEAILRGEVALGGQRAEITMLMTDLRDFTALCERMEPEELVALLNRYFDVMIDAVLEFGGTVDKFVGDAMVVIFNAPLPQHNHPLRAVLTALRMRERLAAFNAEQRLHGRPELRMGIGIHTGSAVVGNIGSDGKRVEYTAMGDTVNVAARLESLTKELAGDVCLSAETERLVRAWVAVGEPVSTTVKGRTAPVTVYRLAGLRPGVDPAALLHALSRERVEIVGA